MPSPSPPPGDCSSKLSSSACRRSGERPRARRNRARPASQPAPAIRRCSGSRRRSDLDAADAHLDARRLRCRRLVPRRHGDGLPLLSRRRERSAPSPAGPARPLVGRAIARRCARVFGSPLRGCSVAGARSFAVRPVPAARARGRSTSDLMELSHRPARRQRARSVSRTSSVGAAGRASWPTEGSGAVSAVSGSALGLQALPARAGRPVPAGA